MTVEEQKHQEMVFREIGECTVPEISKLMSSPPFECNIKVKPNAEQVIRPVRHVPIVTRGQLKQELDRMEKFQVIHKKS